MEPATESLSPRPRAAPSTEPRGDAWGDFLERVLVAAGSYRQGRADPPEARTGDALPQRRAATPRLGAGVAAE